jgi:hypothetical protein
MYTLWAIKNTLFLGSCMDLLEKTRNRVSELEKMLHALNHESIALNDTKDKLKAGITEQGKSLEEEFEEYRSKLIQFNLKESSIINELNSAKTLATLLSQKTAPRFERVIVGSGVAGTLVYQEIDPEMRSKINESTRLPAVISLNDPGNPHTWPKEGKRLMGQPAKVQTPQSFLVHSTDIANAQIDPTNPYQYVVAEDFNHALIQTQCNLDMPIASLKVLDIESAGNPSLDDWLYPDCPYRLKIDLPAAADSACMYIYTDAVDLCAGLGDATRLTTRQIDPVLAESLIEKQSLVYAQDKAVDVRGDVLLYGGSAVNSAWATEILSGHVSTDAKIKGLVARTVRSLESISTLSRFISDATKTTLDLSIGTLKSVEELPSGKLAVTFSAVAETGRFKGLIEDQTMVCDQLIVAIGQDAPAITKNLTNFEECMYDSSVSGIEPVSGIPDVPLGTYSKDGRIIAWGALGTLGVGLSKDEAKIFNKKVEAHANTYPYESQALGGIFRMSVVIPQMARQLTAKGFFPGEQKNNSEFQ